MGVAAEKELTVLNSLTTDIYIKEF